ncbi:hypothetical protein [Chryseobacterium sp. KCF3-3]|uniref:hypothetical protein n=1 Tax=Chryseobacterium sp. KCF3-3 TaxID=3231511 RepID=UPI0038B237BB
MADIGRWGVIDPRSQYTHEAYSYVWNNPIRFNDPTGMTGELATCPTCPNKSEFKPFINDPKNEYFYDSQTNTVSKVTQIEEVVVTGSKPLKTNIAGLSFTNQAFAPAIPIAAYLLEAAYYALVSYAAWDIADRTTDAIKNRDIYGEINEETAPKTFEIFPDLEQETDINGVPVDDSGIMKPFDASIPQEKWMDNFAKTKKGKASARQQEVQHKQTGNGKLTGAKKTKHQKRRPGDLGEKKRQNPNWKQR